jgi:hypothetical protein
MAASIEIHRDNDLGAIALAAGQPDDFLVRYAGGRLYVDGVSQQALEASAASYSRPDFLAAGTEKALVQVLNEHLDSVAGQRRYDSRFTCALRAGFPGPFQAEGLAFAAWMDQCNMTGYTIMQEVKLGQRPVPSAAELIAAMPTIEWPPSPIPEGAA